VAPAKRRFLPGEGLERAKRLVKEATPPTPDEVAAAALAQIDELDVEEIKSKIPKLIYAGILKSAFILDQSLRGKDSKKRKEAAAAFIEKLGAANFLKNLASLSSGQDARDQKKPAKVAWGPAPKDNE